MGEKIGSTHLERKAVVYLRQSSPKQVREHRESTTRQYALRERALQLGWSPEAIEVVDEDLGKSGSSAGWRAGFQRLAEDVAHGRVGALFALEVSRLARSSADWHRLLELAGLADVVIADEDVVYNPRDYNDRLLLGLKGQFADAELYWMRLRLHGGKLSKARRGELVFAAPTGYVWGPDARLHLDPDEHVRRAVQLLFERFGIDGSARAVVRYFSQHGLEMPVRNAFTGDLKWTAPRYHWVLAVLQNPLYTGAYVFGRREERMALVDGEVRRRRVTHLPADAWKVCLRDHHPAYVTWEEYMANQEKLRSNRPAGHLISPDRRGAAREGGALLQGLVLCGRCGHRMYSRYYGHDRFGVYECRRSGFKDGTMTPCWRVSSKPLDDAVADLLLKVIQPPEVDLSLAVARDAERQADEIKRQWQLRLETARYEARLAERRYKGIDPDNRTVARTLEREWNEKLEQVERLEHEYEAVRVREKVDVSAEDRRKMLALARDLPKVWRAPTTTDAERKTLLRMLVREVAITPVDVPRRMTNVKVLWVTGATSEMEVPRPPPGQARRTSEPAVQALRALVAEGRTDHEVAEELNRRDLRSGKHLPWTAGRVAYVRKANGLQKKRGPCPRSSPLLRRHDGLYSTRGVAQLIEVTTTMVQLWTAKGHLAPVEGGGRRPLWFRLAPADVDRLRQLRASLVARGYGPGGRGHAQPISKEEVHCG